MRESASELDAIQNNEKAGEFCPDLVIVKQSKGKGMKAYISMKAGFALQE